MPVANAIWSPEERAFESTYEHPVENGLISTSWGALSKVQFINKESKEKKAYLEGIVRNSLFKSGGQKYRYYFNETSIAGTPLMIINAGLFSSHKDLLVTSLAKRYVQLGYSVVIFANPLSADYLKNQPTFNIINIKKQAEINYVAIQALVKFLKKRGDITEEVHLTGVSYGALLSTVIYALDSREENPFITSTSGFSPPLDIFDTNHNLDKLINESKDSFMADMGSFEPKKLFKLYKTARRLKKLGKEGAVVKERDIKRARALFAQYSFKNSLIRSLKVVQKTHGLSIIPEKKQERKAWKKDLSFSQMLIQVSPKFHQRFSESLEDNLAFWVEEAIKNGRTNIRLILTKDDPINGQIPESLIKSPHVMILEDGGHYGYNPLLWFDQLLNEMYTIKK